MDYVIAGLAAGASLAIVGFLLREAGLSRRLSLPLWLADAGLALMSAAVVTWLLTFTAITTDLDDDSAAATIVAGSAVSLVVAFVLVVHSGSRRRTLMMRTREPVRRAAPVVEPVTQRNQQPFPEPQTPAAAEEVSAAAPAKKDWEEIWRETWGGEELPRALRTTAAPEPETVPSAESETAWETWSTEEEAVRSESVDSGNEPSDEESPAEPVEPSESTSSTNGATQILEPANESE